MRSRAFIAFAATLVLMPALALAQAPARIRGTIEKFDDKTNVLTVKSRDGADIDLTLGPKSAVRTLKKKALSDIHEGDFVASTGRPGADGKLHAVEVRIFTEAQRGTGEGQFPWDLTPDSVMTNATVTGIAAAPHGTILKVNYKGTESSYIVDPDTPILTTVPGDKELLKPNIYVVVSALKQQDGTLLAGTITAEANGVKPPM
jgi:hypothetical protein